MTTPLPALLGGPPVRPEGPPAWPPPDAEVEAALRAAFQAGTWGRYHGPAVPELEAALRDYFQVEHVLLCGSGTFAVELALRAFKVGPGDDVLLSAYDYPGNFLSVHAVGAMPVLVDLEPGGWQMRVPHLKEAIGPACKAVIASHLHGGMVDMAAVGEVASARGLKVVEDAAQCIGATFDGKKAGCWGDAGVLSFGGSKLLSAGRGGAVFFKDADDYQRARSYLLRGNLICPLSELQAAVLTPQLAKLDARNRERHERVRQLSDGLSVSGLRLFDPPAAGMPAYYKVGFQFDAEAFGLQRAAFLKAMRAEGVALDEGFAAAHMGRSPRRYRVTSTLIEAERAHAGCVVLHHPILLDGEEGVQQILEAAHKVYHARREIEARPPLA